MENTQTNQTKKNEISKTESRSTFLAILFMGAATCVVDGSNHEIAARVILSACAAVAAIVAVVARVKREGGAQ